MKNFLKKFKNVKLRDIGHLFLFALALPIALIYKQFRKDLWLFCDNGKEASDNGFVLFQYVCKKYPKQDAVYAVYKSSVDFEKVKATGNFVQYGSFRHWILYLTAKVNISSQKGGKPNYAVCNLLEVYGILRNNRVFLQHGIILTDMTAPVQEKYQHLIVDEGVTPIRRFGMPEDVANCVAAAASGLLDFSTGQVLNADGGFHIRRL